MNKNIFLLTVLAEYFAKTGRGRTLGKNRMLLTCFLRNFEDYCKKLISKRQIWLFTRSPLNFVVYLIVYILIRS